MLSLVFTFRILASLRSARHPAAPFVYVGENVGGPALGSRAGRSRGGATGTDQGDMSAGAGSRSSRFDTADRRGDAAQGATMVKATDTRSASTAKAAARGTRSAADTEKIRAALVERRDVLQAEYDQTLTEITELQRDRLTDSAGDDQADTGTKTFEREQEISLANNLLERITQVERAIERLGEGNYGWCEKCGNAIPVERLAAFPSATLCVTCKQLEERR
jgi:DnaK suppressor protein